MRACTAALRQSLFSAIRTSTAIVWQLLQCAVWAAICAAEGKMPSSFPFPPATRSKFARTSAPSRCLFLRSFFSLYAVARVRLQFLFISRPNPNSFHRLLHQLNSNDKNSNVASTAHTHAHAPREFFTAAARHSIELEVCARAGRYRSCNFDARTHEQSSEDTERTIFVLWIC